MVRRAVCGREGELVSELRVFAEHRVSHVAVHSEDTLLPLNGSLGAGCVAQREKHFEFKKQSAECRATRGLIPWASGQRENKATNSCVAPASLIEIRGGNQDAH